LPFKFVVLYLWAPWHFYALGLFLWIEISIPVA
jgi:heme O synthase-like polyprenyltransferase